MMTVPRLVLIILASAILTAACGGDDEDSPEPTPSPEPSEATQVTTSPASRDSLPAGTHTSENFGISVSVTVGDGWKRAVDAPDFFVVEHPRAVDGPFGYIAFIRPEQVYNPTESTLELGTPPSDFVEWFKTHRLINVIETRDVTVGGIQGTELEIATETFSDFGLFKISDGDYELRFEDRIVMIVLEVSGSQLLVSYGSDLPTNFDAFDPAAQDVLASVEFSE